MNFEEIIIALGENPVEVSKEAARLLIEIAENIITNPNNPKVRLLQKDNATISKKILKINGGTLALKLMGFEENETHYIIPMGAPVANLNNVKDVLLQWRSSIETSVESSPLPNCQVQRKESLKEGDTTETLKPFLLPPLTHKFTNHFLRKIETQFHRSLQYKSKDLQKRAKSLIPYNTLEMGAQKRLRLIQEQVKKSKLEDPNISIQDMLLLELLQWFKEDFFSWVDSPACDYCSGKTIFSSRANAEVARYHFADRVEIHRCETCQRETLFPRYNDLNMLMTTRKGRCGEWANTFTLFCRAMSWDARFVVDETDHVWTEIYSVAQKRWLHCDPCENIYDKPLIYESGWKKTISYVIAYSDEEVQDVTWRYTSHHKEVLKRRNYCSEGELVDALVELRLKRQAEFNPSRIIYLTRRALDELVELMLERKADEGEMEGRQSGDVMWRLARREIQETATKEFIWKITATSQNNTVVVRYSPSSDVYEYLSDDVLQNTIDKWNSGSFSYQYVFRKVESDWKQVYLARKDNKKDGLISWKFELENSCLDLEAIVVKFTQNTFENGKSVVVLCTDDCSWNIPGDVEAFKIDNLSGKKSFTLSATLSGGRGDIAWQHAQLFRQHLHSEEFPFVIQFLFKSH